MTDTPRAPKPGEPADMQVVVGSIDTAASCLDCTSIYVDLDTAARHSLKRGHRVETVVETHATYVPATYVPGGAS